MMVMKMKVMFVVALAILVLTIPSANAKIIVEEQFIYEPPQANIDGQNGGTLPR